MEYNLTSELRALLKYIKEDIAMRYHMAEIDIPTFMLGVVEFSECDAHNGLKSIMLSSDFDALRDTLMRVHEADEDSRKETGNLNNDPSLVTFNERFDAALKLANEAPPIDSVSFWLALDRQHSFQGQTMSKYGITAEQIASFVKGKRKTKKRTKGRSAEITPKSPKQQTDNREHVRRTYANSVVENTLVCLNDLALKGEILPVIGNGPIYDKIFSTWARCERNNVVLVGRSGVGKTATVKHIANLIVNGGVPSMFGRKRLMQMNLANLMPSNGIKGVFEETFKSIVSEATSRDCYIFFIDDISSALSNESHYSDMGIETLMDMILSNRNILFITTATESDYSTLVEANPFFRRRMTKVNIEEKTEEECADIVCATKGRFEEFHNVAFSEEFVKTCIRLSKRYVPSCVLPDTVYDIIDEVGARYSVMENGDGEASIARERLNEAIDRRRETLDNPSGYSMDEINMMDDEILDLTNKFSEAEKREMMSVKKVEASTDVLRKVVSSMSGKDVEDVGCEERERLSSLAEKLSASVIGQENAVDKVARSVKRGRLGLTRPGRPSVFMFVGSTGTGKTLLAKTLATEVYGSEKSMVRLDMSEYSDKTSVNKIYGSSPGYVGYEKGGVLTEAVKKNGNCVILLDEIEKASEEVHDTLLQVFDDGRLTDNKGVTVSFANCIIIMTSNAGAAEADERGDGVGFVKKGEISEAIIMRTIRRSFKPEFINRIDDIIMFNKLTEKNFDDITKIEVGKAIKRILSAGYSVDGDFEETAVRKVRTGVECGKYGARTIPAAVDRLVVDPVSDYILEHGVAVGGVVPSESIA